MTQTFEQLLKEAEGKTPLDFPGIYDPQSFIDPKPLDIAEKLCEEKGIDVDTMSIKELVDFGKEHIKNVWNVQNEDGTVKQVRGYDISAVSLKALKTVYKKWEEQSEARESISTKEDMEDSNLRFKDILEESAKTAYPKYPAQGSTIWEGRLALIDILLVFNNFEASSLGKSSES